MAHVLAAGAECATASRQNLTVILGRCDVYNQPDAGDLFDDHIGAFFDLAAVVAACAPIEPVDCHTAL